MRRQFQHFSGFAGTRFFGTSILRLPLMYCRSTTLAPPLLLPADLPRRLHRRVHPHRADIDHMISGANRVFVVLHHNHTVLPRSRRWISVPSRRSLSRWCRPIDGSSSVHHANRACTNLARQTNTLGFTAGKCLCRGGKVSGNSGRR